MENCNTCKGHGCLFDPIETCPSCKGSGFAVQLSRQDILSAHSLGTLVELTYQCKTENGIERDDTFTIIDIIGDFEQVVVQDQYDLKYTINPNQLVHLPIH